MEAADDEESHGKLVEVSTQSEFQFHLVFSNKTQTDAYCLEIWGKLTAQGVQVWQQQKNIPKDSDNWCAPPRLPQLSLRELGNALDDAGALQVQRVVPERRQEHQDRLLPHDRLPQVPLLHEGVRHCSSHVRLPSLLCSRFPAALL